MNRLFLILVLITTTTISFGQFADTAALNNFVRDTIKDRRPEKVTAAQIQKAFLGTAQFIKPNAVTQTTLNDSTAALRTVIGTKASQSALNDTATALRAASVNVYNSNGTLTGTRIITQNGNIFSVQNNFGEFTLRLNPGSGVYQFGDIGGIGNSTNINVNDGLNLIQHHGNVGIDHTLTLNEYGDGSHGGTAAYMLGVTTGNDVVTVPVSGLNSVTYDDLITDISGHALTPGAQYLITDFRTKYTQRKTNDVKTASAEPLIVTAVSDSSLYEIVKSVSYPSDIIKYTVDNSADAAADKGIIYYREDQKGNSTQYDFRSVTFPRYNADLTGLDTIYAAGPWSASQWQWFVFSPSAGVYQLRLAADNITDLSSLSNNSWTFDNAASFHILADDLAETVMTLTVDPASKVDRYTFDDGSGNEYSSHFNGIKIKSYNTVYAPKGVVCLNFGSASNSIIDGDSYDLTTGYLHNSHLTDIEHTYLPSVSHCNLKNLYAVFTENPMQNSTWNDSYDVFGYAFNITNSTIANINSCMFSISFNNVDCVEFKDEQFWGAYTFSDVLLFNSKVKKFLDRKISGTVYRYWYMNDSGTIVQTTY